MEYGQSHRASLALPDPGDRRTQEETPTRTRAPRHGPRSNRAAAAAKRRRWQQDACMLWADGASVARRMLHGVAMIGAACAHDGRPQYAGPRRERRRAALSDMGSRIERVWPCLILEIAARRKRRQHARARRATRQPTGAQQQRRWAGRGGACCAQSVSVLWLLDARRLVD
jgi:hypothetical protein